MKISEWIIRGVLLAVSLIAGVVWLSDRTTSPGWEAPTIFGLILALGVVGLIRHITEHGSEDLDRPGGQYDKLHGRQ